MYAILNTNNFIEAVCTKPPIRLPIGNTLTLYQPPDLDPKLYQINAVQPVLTDEVQFTIAPKDGAIKEHYLTKIDSDVDYVYSKAVGNRGPEYTQAEKEALEYKASNFTIPAPPYVTSWAEAVGISNEAAANGIIAQADAWRAASLVLRTTRLHTKEQIRLGNYDAMSAWGVFITNIRKQLNI